MPLLDKTYHNPSRWASGGFQGHQDSYSQHPGHGETSGKEIVRCWYETWNDTPGKNGD